MRFGLNGEKRDSKKVMIQLLSFVAALSVLAAPTARAEDGPATSSSSLSSSVSAKDDADPSFTSYKVTKDTSLVIQKLENGSPNGNSSAVTLKAGMNLTVLDVSHDATLGDLVRLGLDTDPQAGLPSDFWVRANDLLAAELQESDIVTNDRDPLDGNDDPMAARGRLSRKGKIGPHHMTYCYHYVKEYLLQHKIVPVYLPGGSAYQAATVLPEYGLKRTGRTQKSAKVGDICVYKGGNGNNGHIEIKRPQGWWYGYGFKQQAVNPADHRLVGCYSK